MRRREFIKGASELFIEQVLEKIAERPARVI